MSEKYQATRLPETPEEAEGLARTREEFALEARSMDRHGTAREFELTALLLREHANILRERSKWQLIETAPKDGTPILLWGGKDDNANYVSSKERHLIDAPCRAAWDGEVWLMAFAEAAYVSVEYLNPTHWMPMPDPPSLKGASE